MKVLQVFNRYLEYGGEEGSVRRIAGLLRTQIHLASYTGSSEEILGHWAGKFRMPFLMLENQKVLDELSHLQQSNAFDVWQIHNVFPGLSVAVYELAADLGVPVIQYLHNYRFGCADATYFRNGQACFECRPGHFMPAIRHRCWRGSLPATLSMTIALTRFWRAWGPENIIAYIALSEAQKQAHVNMGFPEDRIHVIPHYLEDDRADHSLPRSDGDVLFMGRLTDEKGVDLLIRAWDKVDAGGRKLRIVGTGPKHESLQYLVKSNRIGGVVFEGFVPKEDHARLWNNTAFFVTPSVWNEPFGMVVLEAWRQIRPVLATRLGSFPEMIDSGVDGWLADPDVNSFARTLQTALNAPDQYAEMGQAGRTKLQTEFNSDVWLGNWTKLTRSIGF